MFRTALKNMLLITVESSTQMLRSRTASLLWHAARDSRAQDSNASTHNISGQMHKSLQTLLLTSQKAHLSLPSNLVTSIQFLQSGINNGPAKSFYDTLYSFAFSLRLSLCTNTGASRHHFPSPVQPTAGTRVVRHHNATTQIIREQSCKCPVTLQSYLNYWASLAPILADNGVNSSHLLTLSVWEKHQIELNSEETSA